MSNKAGPLHYVLCIFSAAFFIFGMITLGVGYIDKVHNRKYDKTECLVTDNAIDTKCYPENCVYIASIDIEYHKEEFYENGKRDTFFNETFEVYKGDTEAEAKVTLSKYPIYGNITCYFPTNIETGSLKLKDVSHTTMKFSLAFAIILLVIASILASILIYLCIKK
jgi:hypothetical protein